MTKNNSSTSTQTDWKLVRVKPLEWHDYPPATDNDIRLRDTLNRYKAVAHTPFAPYFIKEEHGLYFFRLGHGDYVEGRDLLASIEDAKAAAQADYETGILNALASDASPRGEGPWVAYTQAGAFVAHITSRENSQRMQAAGFDLRCVVAHPAPATVEMREEAAQAALARMRKLRDQYADQAKFADVDEARLFRQFVERLDRAALAPATEGRNG